MRQQNHKLVSTIAGQEIRLAHAFFCPVRYESKHRVACGMPISVVDRFEQVDIESDDSYRLRFSEFLRENLQKVPAVHDARKRINECEFSNLIDVSHVIHAYSEELCKDLQNLQVGIRDPAPGSHGNDDRSQHLTITLNGNGDPIWSPTEFVLWPGHLLHAPGNNESSFIGE